MPSKPNQQLPDDEAERRATDALRRALTTPYKPQSEMKLGSKPKKKRGRLIKTKIKIGGDSRGSKKRAKSSPRSP